MKKIITFMVAMLAWAGIQAEEKTVWEGSEPISWNNEVAPGSQFETPEGIFSGLAVGNTIRVYTTTTYEEPQYVVTYKAGDGWEWTDLSTTVTAGVISYVVESADIATWIAERGLILRGQAWTATKITVDAEAQKPIEGEQTVWEGTQQISWNTEVAPGTQFETPEAIFTGLQKNDIIKFYTTTTYDEPQYVITYKKGDAWEWTDLETTIADGVISYTVADETTATEISERGLVVRGQAYTLTKITVTKQNTTFINDHRVSQAVADNKIYNLQGMEVKGISLKGIYIRNGKKFVIK